LNSYSDRFDNYQNEYQDLLSHLEEKNKSKWCFCIQILKIWIHSYTWCWIYKIFYLKYLNDTNQLIRNLWIE
jgi:hypothetical protein